MDFDRIDRKIRNRRKEWMFPLGVLFIVMATIILIRNLVLVTLEYGFDFFVDNFLNAEITNEKFVIVMIGIGCILIYFGKINRRKGTPKQF
ncbi:MAG: hypothetical protein M3162_06315 [Thermoproteota archaeon]|nr:hypothetical protein [Thermoproteota archaeon]